MSGPDAKFHGTTDTVGTLTRARSETEIALVAACPN